MMELRLMLRNEKGGSNARGKWLVLMTSDNAHELARLNDGGDNFYGCFKQLAQGNPRLAVFENGRNIYQEGIVQKERKVEKPKAKIEIDNSVGLDPNFSEKEKGEPKEGYYYVAFRMESTGYYLGTDMETYLDPQLMDEEEAKEVFQKAENADWFWNITRLHIGNLYD